MEAWQGFEVVLVWTNSEIASHSHGVKSFQKAKVTPGSRAKISLLKQINMLGKFTNMHALLQKLTGLLALLVCPWRGSLLPKWLKWFAACSSDWHHKGGAPVRKVADVCSIATFSSAAFGVALTSLTLEKGSGSV